MQREKVRVYVLARELNVESKDLLDICKQAGFDVKNHAAFVKKLEADGIKLDEPVRKAANGSTLTYITDPWGTRIEIIQRAPLGPQVQ